MTSKELFEQISEVFGAFQANANKFNEKGNKSAASRARKNSLELRKLLAEYKKQSVKETKGQ